MIINPEPIILLFGRSSYDDLKQQNGRKSFVPRFGSLFFFSLFFVGVLPLTGPPKVNGVCLLFFVSVAAAETPFDCFVCVASLHRHGRRRGGGSDRGAAITAVCLTRETKMEELLCRHQIWDERSNPTSSHLILELMLMDSVPHLLSARSLRGSLASQSST